MKKVFFIAIIAQSVFAMACSKKNRYARAAG